MIISCQNVHWSINVPFEKGKGLKRHLGLYSDSADSSPTFEPALWTCQKLTSKISRQFFCLVTVCHPTYLIKRSFDSLSFRVPLSAVTFKNNWLGVIYEDKWVVFKKVGDLWRYFFSSICSFICLTFNPSSSISKPVSRRRCLYMNRCWLWMFQVLFRKYVF